MMEDLMSKEDDILASREAAHGQKMIEVKLRFWTDDIAPEKGKIIPKEAWTSGVGRVERNPAHGIVPESSVPFNSLLGIGSAIEEVLTAHGIVLHPGRKDKKYIQDRTPASKA